MEAFLCAVASRLDRRHPVALLFQNTNHKNRHDRLLYFLVACSQHPGDRRRRLAYPLPVSSIVLFEQLSSLTCTMSSQPLLQTAPGSSPHHPSNSPSPPFNKNGTLLDSLSNISPFHSEQASASRSRRVSNRKSSSPTSARFSLGSTSPSFLALWRSACSTLATARPSSRRSCLRVWPCSR